MKVTQQLLNILIKLSITISLSKYQFYKIYTGNYKKAQLRYFCLPTVVVKFVVSPGETDK